MLRKMTLNDVEAVRALEQECFSRPWSSESIKKEVDNPQSLFCVWEEQGMIAAYAGMLYISGEGDITNVAVTEKYRYKGIAGRMLSEMFEIAYVEGIGDITLEVRESNIPAIKLYLKLGFTTEGVRKDFYDLPKENGLIMWKRK